MSRLAPLAADTMSAEQRRIHDLIAAGPRGRAGGPFPAWLRSPELAQRGQHLGALLRFGTSLPPRLSEMAILMTARHWRSGYEWFAHAPLAAKGGLSGAVIEALRQGQRPSAMAEDEDALYDLVGELYATNRVAAATYTHAVNAFGEAGVVEIVAIAGYYCLVSLTLNAFEVLPPPGQEPFGD